MSGSPGAAVLALALTAGAAMAMAESSSSIQLQGRAITSLPQAEVEDLLAGRGAGMALPAELNRYPGPRHTLDLARELKLSPEQKAETQRLFDAMQTEAIPLGQAVVAKEAELDRLFTSGAANELTLRAVVVDVTQLRGELRFTHLKYHLAMQRLLTPEQVTAYDAERGYSSSTGGHQGHAGGATHQR